MQTISVIFSKDKPRYKILYVSFKVMQSLTVDIYFLGKLALLLRKRTPIQLQVFLNR